MRASRCTLTLVRNPRFAAGLVIVLLVGRLSAGGDHSHVKDSGRCVPSAMPEFPHYSPARAAATRADGVCDVVSDYIVQASEPPTEKSPTSSSEELSGVADSFSIYRERLPSEESDASIASDVSAATDSSNLPEPPSYYWTLPRVILLHSDRRISNARLQELKATLEMCGQFEKVLVIDGRLPEEMHIPHLLFTDSPTLVHEARTTRHLVASFYEGYFLNAPNIASGLRRYAAVNGVQLSNNAGTRFPGGVNWMQTTPVMRREKTGTKSQRLMSNVVNQLMATTSYFAIEDLMHGVEQVLKYLRVEMDRAAAEATNPTSTYPMWVLLYDDNAKKSNCYMARIMHQLLEAKASKDYTQPFAYVSMHDTDHFSGKFRAMKERPSRLFVVVMDDNSCTGGQMTGFLRRTLASLLSWLSTPLQVIVAPIFSTASAGLSIPMDVLMVLGNQVGTRAGRRLAPLVQWTKPVSHAGIVLDRVTRYAPKAKSTGTKQLTIDIVQYVIVASIYDKVFRSTSRGDAHPIPDPRGNFLEFQVRQVWPWPRKLFLNSFQAVGFDEMAVLTMTQNMMMGKVSLVMDWKVVDHVSMPEEVTYGTFGFGNTAPIRYIQGSCPPYKLGVAAEPKVERMEYCAKKKKMMIDPHYKAYLCDAFQENIYAESFRFEGYRTEPPVPAERKICIYRGKTLHMEFMHYSKVGSGRESSHAALLKKDPGLPVKTRLCDRLQCRANAIEERSQIAADRAASEEKKILRASESRE